MELKDKYFVAVYTNEVKDYAAKEFFAKFNQFSKGMVIDNSTNKDYIKILKTHVQNLPVVHLDIPYEPKKTLFLRNVCESVSFLRNQFLNSGCSYFLILESDVIITDNFLEKLEESITKLPSNWGALGCLYYQGFHDYTKSGIQQGAHILSGATVYKREAIEKYPFRWSEENLAAFPDAWWSYDAGKEYSLWNNHDIRLPHLHNKNGTRYSKKL